ncbi:MULTISPECIES: LysR family transcriptional regulator [Pseudomonas]|uniref:Transcriptional regulator n=1 Tax=Pseudomonas chlororaphis TaxID=587753 RepID=A0A0D5XXZ1_9PSED|nr:MULTISPECIES: LysR family transcriptional regulator [Pseudomonas]AJO79286.1 transcriptional regulator [Pseudomonas sp. MRSN 12121]AKA23941.1 transcriptional regulator [Pseudomonas chlororaphis]MCB2252535.1 LysR family transcriptional regulator [Pseudomonas chlororaphis]
MPNLSDLELFVLIAELEGLSPAARIMSITPAAASLALKRLENRLGVRLFTRSTRAMKLTPEGMRYLESAQHALKILANGKRSLTHDDGMLELTVSSDLGRHLLLDLLTRLKQQRPRLHIKLALSDKEEDLLKGRFDAALRYGKSLALDLVELPVLKRHHFIACAAPEYLAEQGEPASPQHLGEHECIICHSIGRPETHWRFYAPGQVEEVRVQGHFCCDDGDAARRWAVAGHGVVYLPLLNVVEDLFEGRLRPLLAGWQGDAAPLSLVVSHRSQITDSLRALHHCLVEHCTERMARYLDLMQPAC